MYIPTHFEETNPDPLKKLIADHPLGAMVTLTPSGAAIVPPPLAKRATILSPASGIGVIGSNAPEALQLGPMPRASRYCPGFGTQPARAPDAPASARSVIAVVGTNLRRRRASVIPRRLKNAPDRAEPAPTYTPNEHQRNRLGTTIGVALRRVFAPSLKAHEPRLRLCRQSPRPKNESIVRHVRLNRKRCS